MAKTLILPKCLTDADATARAVKTMCDDPQVVLILALILLSKEKGETAIGLKNEFVDFVDNLWSQIKVGAIN